MRLLKRTLGLVLALGLALALLAGYAVRRTLVASLPQLDGELRLTGLSGLVRVERNHLGVPTIHGASRTDVARATGFLHAQDRFFQMDLLRRRAAGELAALVGVRALDADRDVRVHRLRAVAHEAVGLLGSADRALLDAYVAGVNAGLQALGAKPFEYYLLRQDPEPWRTEDSLLVVLAMFVTLQDSNGTYESTLGTMRDLLPREALEFLAPRGTDWDSPVVGGAFEMRPIPSAAAFNPRARRSGRPTRIPLPQMASAARRPPLWWPSSPNSDAPVPGGAVPNGAAPGGPVPSGAVPSGAVPSGAVPSGARTSAARARHAEFPADVATGDGGEREAAAVGSNNFAVAGSLTPNGGALLANDMHLAVRVPNTWYRAVFEWTDADGRARTVAGVTLPGMPPVVAGSNTDIAWGFTNTYGDWSDIVELDVDPTSPRRYRTPAGVRSFVRHEEVIHVAGGPDVHAPTDWTIWGPVMSPDHSGRQRAFAWVAYDAHMLASSIAPLESARTLDEAFAQANGAGTPGQNMLVADREGHIAWTVYGSIPRRFGFDGALPGSWADGTRGWSGYLAKDQYPRIVDPPGGRLWTANNRVVGGEMLAVIGDGSFEVGSRARIIRERLNARERFTPSDLLAIQLDAEATFLERWRGLVLKVLTPDAVAAHPRRARFREAVEHGWTGTASPDSAGYRLTRAFRDRVSQWAFAFLLADCVEADERFDYTSERKREGPLWLLVTERPLHLLDPRFASWDAFLLAAIDRIIDDLARDFPGDLTERRWSEANVTAYRHPLSAAVPFLKRWLDMPARALPGDLYTPRMATGAVAASERMVVSPGHEAQGIMETPTGQSGHPLSPHYADSHDAWVMGEPTPFLPGSAVHVLRLTP